MVYLLFVFFTYTAACKVGDLMNLLTPLILNVWFLKEVYAQLLTQWSTELTETNQHAPRNLQPQAVSQLSYGML